MRGNLETTTSSYISRHLRTLIFQATWTTVVLYGNRRNSMKRIVITGTSGYLGQHLLHAFLTAADDGTISTSSNYHVYALYRSAQGFPEAVKAIRCASNVTVTIERLDLTDSEQVSQWVERHSDLDVCIHAAAMSSPKLCQEQADAARACNVPTAFFDALRKLSVQIIALSTDQVYDGTQPPYSETDSTRACNFYGQSKLEMEEHLLSINDDIDHDSENPPQSGVTILRSSIMLGSKAPILPSIAHGTFLHFCQSREGVETEFYTDERRSVVAVADVVAVIQSLVANDNAAAAGIFNLGGPQSVSRLEMAEAVFSYSGYDKRYLIAKEKATLKDPPQVPSPLDISMDNSKITELTQRKFQVLEEIVRATFSETKP
jgi:dTDP-4-dehydrorhamnose reductase